MNCCGNKDCPYLHLRPETVEGMVSAKVTEERKFTSETAKKLLDAKDYWIKKAADAERQIDGMRKVIDAAKVVYEVRKEAVSFATQGVTLSFEKYKKRHQEACEALDRAVEEIAEKRKCAKCGNEVCSCELEHDLDKRATCPSCGGAGGVQADTFPHSTTTCGTCGGTGKRKHESVRETAERVGMKVPNPVCTCQFVKQREGEAAKCPSCLALESEGA